MNGSASTDLPSDSGLLAGQQERGFPATPPDKSSETLCVRGVRLACCGWLLIASLASSTDAADTIRLATLNCEFLVLKKVHVKFGLPFDPKEWNDSQRVQWDQPGYREARFREAVQTIAKVIQRLNADMIGLVEVGDAADVSALATELQAIGAAYPHVAVCRSSDTFTGQHVALLSRRPLRDVQSEITGRAAYDTELDDIDSETDTGVSKGLSAVFDIDGQPRKLYLVHLASERGGHEKDAQRIAQATIVRRHVVRDLMQDRGVIVMGDMNDHRGQPALRRLRGRDDIWDDLIQTAGPTFHPPRSGETSEQYNRRVGDHWTYEFAGTRNQLDHILISPAVLAASGRRGIAIKFVSVTERMPTSGLLASDHRAVVLTLTTHGAAVAPASPDDPP